MIKKLRIRNLRSLRDTGYVEIKPLTILLGSNSSGKSTFLRAFPLMTQSVNKRLRSAIAWFDENLVDFGDFSTAINRGAAKQNEPIILSFIFEEINGIFGNTISSYYLRQLSKSRIYKDLSLSVAYLPKADNKGAYISNVKFGINDNIVDLVFSEKGHTCEITVNQSPINIPRIKWLDSGLMEYFPTLRIEEFESTTTQYSRKYNFIENCKKWATSPLKKYCSGRFNHYEKLFTFLYRWDIDKQKCLDNFRKFNDIKSLKNNIGTWDINSSRFLEVYNQILVYMVIQEWDTLSSAIADYFKACDYAAPLRAEAKRYYRNQGLQTDVIDAYGRNTSEFIDSLSETQKTAYNEYLKKILNIELEVRNNTGHQSVVVKSGDIETNMTDVGFGYSQILPIITKLWLTQTRRRFVNLNYYGSPYAIELVEQPELHLHPGMQAKLADAFIRAVINREAPTTIVIETHSPTIINRIGRRIREKHIDKDAVNIIIFDQDRTTGNTILNQVRYNDEGQIEKWPYGFFEPKNDPF